MAAGKRYLATTTEAELSQQLGAERAKALESGAPTLAERHSAVLQNTANRLEAGLCQTGPQLYWQTVRTCTAPCALPAYLNT